MQVIDGIKPFCKANSVLCHWVVIIVVACPLGPVPRSDEPNIFRVDFLSTNLVLYQLPTAINQMTKIDILSPLGVRVALLLYVSINRIRKVVG
jgi:hypothetical protein